MERSFRFNKLGSNYLLQLENGQASVNRMYEALDQECRQLLAEGKISMTLVHDEFQITVHPSVDPAEIAARLKTILNC